MLILLILITFVFSCSPNYNTEEYELRSPSLYFSEYVDGDYLNKAIEIYNALSEEVQISEYSIKIYYNGNIEPKFTLNLNSFVLIPDEVYVIGNSSIDKPELCNQLSGGILFNGNDVLELYKGTNLIDSFGKIGEIVEYWNDMNFGTNDCTLRRKTSVTGGDNDSKNEFIPSYEWISIGYNILDGLGVREN